MPRDLSDVVREASPQQLARFVATLPADDIRAVESVVAEMTGKSVGQPPWDGAWRAQARSEQIRPSTPHRVWYVRGGRGSGKTWAGSNNLAELIVESAPGEWAVVAPTYGDGRDVCIESQTSGLIKALGGRVGSGGILSERGPYISTWNRSMGELRLRSGSVVFVDGADDGALRVQGKNLRGAWCDEIGLWRQWQTAWDESIRYAVRVSPAYTIATGTPKHDRTARRLIKRLIDDDAVPVSLLRTEDNAEHLDAGRLADLLSIRGTRLGRQELEGELLEDVEGALWQRAWFEREGFRLAEPPRRGIIDRIVVALDPADGIDEGDEQALVVACRALDHRYYVLHSEGVRMDPIEWVKRAIGVYQHFGADRLIYEKNHGGRFLAALVKQAVAGVEAPIAHGSVDATKAKRTRAEPIAMLYEQGLVSHVGRHEDLEDQMSNYTGQPGEASPDRLDAAVWALTELHRTRYMGLPPGGHSGKKSETSDLARANF